MKVTDDMAGRDDGSEEAGEAGDNKGTIKKREKPPLNAGREAGKPTVGAGMWKI